MKQFEDKNSRDEFRQWMKNNPQGFYINMRGRKDPMLHSVGCWHLGSGEGMNCTTNPKICSTDKQELINWTRELALELDICGDCAAA
jgi:hypothetical protein